MSAYFHPETGRPLKIVEEATLFAVEPVFVDAETGHRVFREHVDTEQWASVNARACARCMIELRALGNALSERLNGVDQQLGATLLVQAQVIEDRRQGFLAKTRGRV